MKLTDLLIGKKVKIMTDMKVEVELTIKSVEDTSFTQELTRWGPIETVQNWTVTFTNGAKKQYGSLESIEILL